MLELKHIRKVYTVGDIKTVALDDINVAFREREFVAILGASGSGKTTCLNIVGGLDRYDSGEMTIKGKNTRDFRDKDWDAYRNNSIGFVFQSYNLITHISIVDNVEMSMTLSGVSGAEKRRRAVEVLERVGLKDHLHKKPNQLSGGQMQRVAIARALVNNPEILLCDEPTGALDSTTSVQIMDLIKEIAKDRLVIMVTHNARIAEKYADRIIQFEDGLIVSDTNPHEERPKEDQFNLLKTSMSFFTALRLSFNNIRTKKGRTFLTSFASSIGIIGIALILSLSTGIQIQIDKIQTDAMAEFPVLITPQAMNMSEEAMAELHENRQNSQSAGRFPDIEEVIPWDPSANTIQHVNKITKEYVEYLKAVDGSDCGSLGFIYIVDMNLLRKDTGVIKPVSITSGVAGLTGGGMMAASSMRNMGLSSYPTQLNQDKEPYLEKNYDLLAGSYPEDEFDMVLVVDRRNRIDYNVLDKFLGFETKDLKGINFSDLVGMEFRLIFNDQYYTRTDQDTFTPKVDPQELEEIYDSAEAKTIRISGILREKPDNSISLLSPGLAYSDVLSELVVKEAEASEIVAEQMIRSYSVFTKQEFPNEETKGMALSKLGGNPTPVAVMIYPTSFNAKERVLAYLDEYNQGKEQEDIIIYTDLVASISNMTSGFMDVVTWALIAFASISLFVSLIMIGILTYTSVLERTKEIGILRALGARKKDITRVFDAETCILGVFSGILGIAIAYLLTIPINAIVFRMAEVEGVSQLRLIHAGLLIVISTVLTMMGGHIPARMASRKDAVEALRTE
ncbi:MAG: ATP-binding cassette domain-containing protein [Oscillospiraceae bacterium]|nr:ATP-binding cassette domain-containing protein [Oscillospiraceae bacterium]